MKRFGICLLLFVWGSLASAQNAPGKNNPNQFTLDTLKIKAMVENGQHILDYEEINKVRLDSVFLLAGRALTDSKQIHSQKWQNEALLLTCKYYLKKDDTVSFEKYARQVIDNYHNSGEFIHEAETWTTLGEIFYDRLGGGEKSLWYFEHALSIYKQHNSILNIALITQEKAYVMIYRLNDTTGYHELENAAKSFKKYGSPQYYECQFVLADYHWKKDETKLALQYYNEAMKGAEANHDKSQMVYGYANLGTLYGNLHMYPEALKYYALAVTEYKELKRYDDLYTQIGNAVNVMLSMGQNKEALLFLKKWTVDVPPVNYHQNVVLYAEYGDCLNLLNRFGEAEKYYLKMVSIFEAHYTNKLDRTNSDSYTKCYRTIANFYLKVKEFTRARFYFEKLLQVPLQFTEPGQAARLQYALFRIDSAEGKFISAINHFEKSKQINDSIFSASRTKQISELNIKYETSQHLQSIKLLNSEKNRQHTELRRINLQRNIIFGSAVLLLAIAALAYWGYRQKQKSNTLLQAQRKEIDSKNLTLETLLLEKDWLLKEVHHRVKNNLQIVMSLLNTQSAFLKNNAAIEAIKESQNRVYAISLLHQKLYNSSNMVTIRMQTYIKDLINNLDDCFGANYNGVSFSLEVENIEMDLVQAVPLGLILNEAITNAVKYAFTGKKGNVDVVLKRISKYNLQLIIADNGNGLPANFDILNTTSLGMEMMKALSKQLDGTFNIRNNEGVEISVEFKLEEISSMLTSYQDSLVVA